MYKHAPVTLTFKKQEFEVITYIDEKCFKRKGVGILQGTVIRIHILA